MVASFCHAVIADNDEHGFSIFDYFKQLSEELFDFF